MDKVKWRPLFPASNTGSLEQLVDALYKHEGEWLMVREFPRGSVHSAERHPWSP